MLASMGDRRVREKIGQRIDALANDPDKQGKALAGELTGYRSVRAVGQRYRIIFEVQRREAEVVVLGVGLRRQGDKSDIYALAKKLLRLGLIEGM
jgi:mRNA interferase RelE/StbE